MKLFEDLPSQKTPVNAKNLNQFKDKLVVVSPTEPTGDNREKIWIQKGKNVLNTENTLNQTLNGVTVSRNSDGTITLNGSATTGFLIVLVPELNKRLNGNYTFSYKVVSGSMTKNNVRISVNDNTSKDASNETARLFSTVWEAGKTSGEISNTINNKQMHYLVMWINSGCIFNNCKLSFQVEPGVTSAEHEAYTQPRIYVKNDNDAYEELISKDELINYSTKEQKIGTWVDGKTLYRKVVNFGSLPNSASKTVSTGLTNVNYISFSGLANNGTTYFPLNLARPISGNNLGLGCWITNNEITIESANDRSSYNAYVIIEYTKTTD